MTPNSRLKSLLRDYFPDFKNTHISFAPLRLKTPVTKAKRLAQSVNYCGSGAHNMGLHTASEYIMFRSLAALSFIVVIQPLAALLAFLVMRALDVSGVLGFIVGATVFVGSLTAAVMILAAIDARISNSRRGLQVRPNTPLKRAR